LNTQLVSQTATVLTAATAVEQIKMTSGVTLVVQTSDPSSLVPNDATTNHHHRQRPIFSAILLIVKSRKAAWSIPRIVEVVLQCQSPQL